jgi:pimeloyl-ACP methyl ester carboxylesterase
MTSYLDAVTSTVLGDNGISYSYRQFGNDAARPLVLLQHFRGNLDNWDPALLDALARDRVVIAFDNTGVGASTGEVPRSVTQMAYDAISFIDALGFEHVDILGFSLGGLVAQEIALIRPDAVGRIVLAATAPQGAQACTVGLTTSSTRSVHQRPPPTSFCTHSSQGVRRVAQPEVNSWAESSLAPKAATRGRTGQLATPITTQSSNGASPTTACSNG